MPNRRYTERELGEAVMYASGLAYRSPEAERLGRRLAERLSLPVEREFPRRARWERDAGCIREGDGPMILLDFSTAAGHARERHERYAPEFVRRYNAAAEVLELAERPLNTVSSVRLDEIMAILRGGQP